MPGGWSGKLRRVDRYRWEIPQDYKPGMKVPGLVYADGEMMKQIQEDQALEQVANVACLPGIVGRSLAMPDIHWGYGFPVGGVAATRLDTGVVSPGGIGYDINCLAADSRVLLADGCHATIEALADAWERQALACFDLPRGLLARTAVRRYIAIEPHNRVLHLTTEAGDEITATEDHPFWTPDGMVPLGELRPGAEVAVYPFVGLPYERPPHRLILDEVAVRDQTTTLQGLDDPEPELQALRERGLLPLYLDDPRVPALLRLAGFATGSGGLSYTGRAHRISFYGRLEDLEEIRRDVATVGFRPSRVCHRRRHRVAARYGTCEFGQAEHGFHARARGLALLLAALGVPVGNEARVECEMPAWIRRAPLWQQRLYVAALFGAELTAPSLSAGCDLCCPCLGTNRDSRRLASGQKLMEQLRDVLRTMGVEASVSPAEEQGPAKDGGRRVWLRLVIASTPQNLVRFFTRIGFEYHREKRFLGVAYAQYLKRKLRAIGARETAAGTTVRLPEEDENLAAAGLVGTTANHRFVERFLWGGRKAWPRVPEGRSTFAEYAEWATRGLARDGMLWERVARIEAVEHAGPVYDFTVLHQDHDFVANGFVVSNCGVRVLRTELAEGDVRPRLEKLADELFRAVPSGLGQGGRVQLSRQDLDRVLERGAGWAVEKGYGSIHDLEHVEERGALRAADPDAVSERAKERGAPQLGTLGSGNHFLEVQVVDEILDPPVAAAFGLTGTGQVVVFVHTGSRGLGHQVCTDYLRVAEASVREHGISLPDRQLACMPLGSPEAQRYLGAMAGAANFAFANRQLITHWVREAFGRAFGRSAHHLGLELVYDVAHNIAKIEEYEVEGRRMRLCVHRKGATRAFPAGDPALPGAYREVGQPVLIPGDMGRYSYVAVGTERAMREAFGSTCHGAGRLQSRGAAKRSLKGTDLLAQLGSRGIVVRAHSKGALAEEAPQAYKDVADVVRVVDGAGISRAVARLRPLAVVKG